MAELPLERMAAWLSQAELAKTKAAIRAGAAAEVSCREHAALLAEWRRPALFGLLDVGRLVAPVASNRKLPALSGGDRVGSPSTPPSSIVVVVAVAAPSWNGMDWTEMVGLPDLEATKSVSLLCV